jgi:hypothetical protein
MTFSSPMIPPAHPLFSLNQLSYNAAMPSGFSLDTLTLLDIVSESEVQPSSSLLAHLPTLSKQLAAGPQNPFIDIGGPSRTLPHTTSVTYLHYHADVTNLLRPFQRVSHQLGHHLLGLAFWLSPLVLHPKPR